MEEGNVPLLMSLPQMRNLGFQFELSPQKSFLNCTRLGIWKHQLRMSKSTHLDMDFQDIAWYMSAVYWARFFLHLFTVLFCPLRARAFFDMLPLDHPPPGLCWFVLCTSCGFCFDLPRDHPMFGVHLLSFAPLWVFGFLLNLFWARFRPSTRPRHAWGSLRCFAQGSFWTSFGPCFDHPRDHPMFGVHYGLHTVLFGPLSGLVLTFHATTPCLGLITVCTRFFLDLFRALF